MFARKREGATLGLIPFVILVLALLGITFYYVAQFFGGNRQLANGTDSGALAAAKQMIAVGLTAGEVNNLPIEFQSLGVDQTGQPTGLNADGSPNLASAIFNVYAFNRAAGLTLLVALNAAEDGSPAAVANANNLINALNTFGQELNNDLASNPQLSMAFENLAASNSVNMLGSQASITLGNNGDLQFAKVPGEGGGQANIYFNNAIYANDPNLTNWIQKMTSNAGSPSQVNSRYNQGDPSAQPGQPMVVGYQTIDMTAITGVPNFARSIYTCAVNPSLTPHMIDSGRFNNPGIPANCYAPSNSISVQGQATTNGQMANNLLCTALACAMLASYDNEYPINMPYGWIRIQNGKDAIAANPNLAPVPLYAGNGDTLYNRQLSPAPGGNYGIWSANNGVFCTEAFDDPNDPFNTGPAGFDGGAEIKAWATANTSPCTGSCTPDANGLNPVLDPNLPQPDGTYILGYQSPTVNMRFSATFNQTATLANCLGITSVNPDLCNNTMYTGPANGNGFASDSSTPLDCVINLNTWASNYIPANYWVPPDDYGTQPVGGLTNLEYVKGAVIGGLDGLWDSIAANGGGGESNPLFNSFTFTLNVGQNPSGSKAYGSTVQGAPPYLHDGLTNYATPAFADGVAFGTIATPFQLIQQLGDNQPVGVAANCGDSSPGSNQWTDVTTPLGKLLQRCQMIVPSTTPTDVANLLNTYKIDLNQYQYIYLPAGATKLVISNTPPAYLKQFPEYNNPGSTLPDGTPSLYACQDALWGAAGNGQTNTPLIGQWTTPPGSPINSGQTPGVYNGDDTTNGNPFYNYAGQLATWDAMNWTSNSGRFFFLGQLSFGNYVNGNGIIASSNNIGTGGGSFNKPN